MNYSKMTKSELIEVIKGQETVIETLQNVESDNEKLSQIIVDKNTEIVRLKKDNKKNETPQQDKEKEKMLAYFRQENEKKAHYIKTILSDISNSLQGMNSLLELTQGSLNKTIGEMEGK